MTAFKGHFALWKNGIRHRDVSPSSLMYKAEGNNVFGVLNDFDLATVVDDVTGYDRTGTVPFMALELLDICTYWHYDRQREIQVSC